MRPGSLHHEHRQTFDLDVVLLRLLALLSLPLRFHWPLPNRLQYGITNKKRRHLVCRPMVYGVHRGALCYFFNRPPSTMLHSQLSQDKQKEVKVLLRSYRLVLTNRKSSYASAVRPRPDWRVRPCGRVRPHERQGRTALPRECRLQRFCIRAIIK